MPKAKAVTKVTTPAPAMPPVKAEALATKPVAKAGTTVTKPAAKPKQPVHATIKLSIALDSSVAVVDKLIASIKLRGAKLDIDLHSAACASLNHVALHNDPVLLNRLINAMPKSARKNAVTVWALRFGNVVLNDSKIKAERDAKPLVYLSAKDGGKAADIDGAVAMPFWELKDVKEGGGSEWLYMDYIGNVLKKLSAVAVDMNHPEHKKAKAALDALTAVNEAMIADKPDALPVSEAVH